MPRYGRSRFGRRRLGGGFPRGPYMRPSRNASLRPVPYSGKRKFPSITGAPLRFGRRVRPRMAASLTFTKTQTKRRQVRVVTHGDNQSSSVNTIGKPYMSRFDKIMYRKIVSPQTIYTNNYNNYTSSQGLQNLVNFSYMTKTDLTTMHTNANGGTPGAIPLKFFLKGGKQVIRIRNQSNTTCNLKIYDLYFKKNSPSTSTDTPSELWAKGLTDYSITDSFNVVGFTPQKSPEFNQYLGIHNVLTVYLEPGQQHDHTIYHKYNRVVDSIEFENNSGLSLAHLTRYTMLVWHGTLGHESTAASTVSYMPITLDVAWSTEWTYGWIEKTTRSFAVTNNMPKTIADYDFMGETGDADTNIAAA